MMEKPMQSPSGTLVHPTCPYKPCHEQGTNAIADHLPQTGLVSSSMHGSQSAQCPDTGRRDSQKVMLQCSQQGCDQLDTGAPDSCMDLIRRCALALRGLSGVNHIIMQLPSVGMHFL